MQSIDLLRINFKTQYFGTHMEPEETIYSVGYRLNYLILVASPERFELSTCRLEVGCSIQLS